MLQAPDRTVRGVQFVETPQKRGREFEQGIRIDYLEGLGRRYEDWISTYKGNLIIVDGDTVKFGESAEDLQKVTDMIDAKLFGLFPMEG